MLGLARLILFVLAGMGSVLELCCKHSYRDSSAVAKQCLHRANAFPASHPTPLVRRLGIHKKLEWDTAGKAELN